MGSTAEGSRAVFIDYERHSNVGRISTESVLNASLRRNYPDHSLTIVSPYTCDLVGFAKAGHATAEIDRNKDCFISTRSYRASGNRLSVKEGALVDDITFAKYDYVWRGHSFIVFMAECSATESHSELSYFILYKANPRTLMQPTSVSADELISAVARWSIDLHSEIYIYDGYWQKSPELWAAIQDSSWEDVILNEETKRALIGDVEGFFDSRDAYKRFAIQWKRGIILHGSPGNGKTISIKALIKSLSSRLESIPSLYVKSFAHCSGPQQAIADIFQKARATAPCLLIFEDLDSLVTDEVRSYFLNEVDGLQSNDGILILGSTNHLDKLDPAIVKRPSRFDRKYPFNSPVLAQREQYARYWVKKLESVQEVDFRTEDCTPIAELTDGFTFAYLKEAFVATLFHLFANQAESEAGCGTDGRSAFVKAFEKQVGVLREQMSEESEKEKAEKEKAEKEKAEEEKAEGIIPVVEIVR